MKIWIGQVRTTGGHIHEHPPGAHHWIISLRISARAKIQMGSKHYILDPGTIVVVPPNTPYRVESDPDEIYEDYYATIFMPPHWDMWNNWPEVMPGCKIARIAQTPVWDMILASFIEAKRIFEQGAPLHPQLAFNAIERVLLLATSVTQTTDHSVWDERIVAVSAYANERLDQKLVVDELAAHACLSSSRLSQLFKQKLGESPMRHVEGIRIRRAQSLLITTQMKIIDIARAVGYEDPYHFSRRFHAYARQSPSAFRRKPGGD